MQDTNNKTTQISKRFTDEDIKKLARDKMYIECDPEYIFRDVSGILEKLGTGTEPEKRQARKQLQAHSPELIMATGLENHYHIANAVSEEYKPLVLSVIQQIEKDYKCTTAPEKATAELVALAHVRVIIDQKRLSQYLDSWTGVTSVLIGYGALLSKQADRSQRQYLSAIMVLKQLKQPQLEVNIKTQNAFVAQNQQVNANPSSHENIEPK